LTSSWTHGAVPRLGRCCLCCSDLRPLHPLLNPRYHKLFAQVQNATGVDVAPLYLAYFTSARTAIVSPTLHAKALGTFHVLGRNQTPKAESWVDVWTAVIKYAATVDGDDWLEIWASISAQWVPDTSSESLKKVSTERSAAYHSYHRSSCPHYPLGLLLVRESRLLIASRSPSFSRGLHCNRQIHFCRL
jgi:hypothetical protein